MIKTNIILGLLVFSTIFIPSSEVKGVTINSYNIKIIKTCNGSIEIRYDYNMRVQKEVENQQTVEKELSAEEKKPKRRYFDRIVKC